LITYLAGDTMIKKEVLLKDEEGYELITYEYETGDADDRENNPGPL
jgi:hypothetical protein